MSALDFMTDIETTRLLPQRERIFECMSDGNYWTLQSIAHRVGASEAGVSARLRDFRKAEWGSHTVMKKQKYPSNQWLYQLVVNGPLLDGKRNVPSAKMEARERVTDFLNAYDSSQSLLAIRTIFGQALLCSDLRELLK